MTRILYVLLIMAFACGSLMAQQEIQRSTEKVRIDGKVYYTHTVKKKETLYSLSKAYDVTTNDILQHNGKAAAGLKVGMLLYIPVNEAENAADSATSVANAEQQAKLNALKGRKYKKHTVRWFETLEEIAQKYNVSVESIISLNDLKQEKLKSRQVLLIPDMEYIAAISGESTDTPARQEDTTDDNQIDSEAESVLVETVDGVKQRAWNDPIEIAYILPLNSKDTNNINSNFMDFYAGVLLAINDSKGNGAKVKVNIYDQNDYTPLHKLIDEPGFESNQLIVGPVRTNDLTTFTGYAIQKQIPLVSPLDNTSEYIADENQYFIQMPANAKAQITNTVNLLEKVKNLDSVSTVLLIHEKNNVSDSLYVNRAKHLLESKGIAYTPVSYGILEGRDIYKTMLSMVDTLSTKPHIALIPSNSEAFVSDAIRNLDLCTKSGAKITLVGLPKWRNFETINVDLYHKMRLHVSLPYFVDYNNEVVKRFLKQYRALYSTEPTPFAYQGYDITKYLLDQMLLYGNSFIYSKALNRSALLQSDFELFRDVTNAKGGLKNNATRNIVYKQNMTIEVIY